MSNIPFQTIDWNSVEKIEYKGETGIAIWHLLVSGAHRGGDHAFAAETCASACLLWRFESLARNRLHNLG
jgi:hypothetical protein